MKALPEVPRMFLLRQRFARPKVPSRETAVRTELARAFPAGSLRPGARIGVTVGSRGIAGIAEITRAAVDYFKSVDARPFIIPSMGSHGGATAEGQRALIAHYGVTEDAMGCPIHARMETRSIGRTAAGMEVFAAAEALEADAVLLMNRIKPHTDYKGPIESGLAKIAAIGLGKLEGATSYHSRIFDLGLGAAIRAAAEKIVDTGKVLGGLAILENAYHETAGIVAIPVARLFEEEERLLGEAASLMGRLPFNEFDLLLCDRMGKNISGAGLDTNIIGRSVYGYVQGEPWLEGMPSVHRIFVRTLSRESNGNAVGMGLVEFTTERFLASVNLEYTRLNAFTACSPLGARPPIALDTDAAAIRTALSTCMRRPEGFRVAYIRDTLSLEDVYVSEAFRDEAQGRDDLSILSAPQPLPFDAGGWLASPFEAVR